MAEGPKEIFDQEGQPKEREGNEKYNEAFKEFVKPGVGEINEEGNEEKIEKARAAIKVGGDYKPVTPTENIFANQHYQETIEKNPVRNSRPSQKSRWKEKTLLALAAVVGAFGVIHKASERQEEVDRVKDSENAARQKHIDENKASQRINYNEKGQVESVKMPDEAEYEVKE